MFWMTCKEVGFREQVWAVIPEGLLQPYPEGFYGFFWQLAVIRGIDYSLSPVAGVLAEPDCAVSSWHYLDRWFYLLKEVLISLSWRLLGWKSRITCNLLLPCLLGIVTLQKIGLQWLRHPFLDVFLEYQLFSSSLDWSLVHEGSHL